MTLPLALFASSYNDDDVSGSTIQNSKASYMGGKGNQNDYNLANNNSKNKPNLRKTIKQKPTLHNESKLTALLKSMDESSDTEDESEDNNLANYNAIGGNNNTSSNQSNSSGYNSDIRQGSFPPMPQVNYKGETSTKKLNATSIHSPDIPTSSVGTISTNAYNSMPSTYANQYYKQFAPYINQGSSEMQEEPKGELIEKLNYIIDLLEEQQDYKTNSIFEDLILYTFLGIFVIFIVDSFSRSGKYVR
jgi:hypothetical protein